MVLTINFDFKDEDLPLTYTLYYIKNKIEIVIIENTHASKCETLLPLGKLTIYGIITDIYGAVSKT